LSSTQQTISEQQLNQHSNAKTDDLRLSEHTSPVVSSATWLQLSNLSQSTAIWYFAYLFIRITPKPEALLVFMTPLFSLYWGMLPLSQAYQTTIKPLGHAGVLHANGLL
jgi:hypothetical protein